MKAEILQEQLLSGVAAVLKAVSSRVQLPVLSHILIEAEKQGFILSATDLELGIKVKIPAKVEESGKCTVPAKMIYEFLASIAPGKVRLESDATSLKIKAGGYSASFQGMPVEEFPSLPEFSGQIGSIEGKELSLTVEKSVFASARDSLRPVLTGLLLEFGKGIKLVATDGFRLAVQKAKAKNSGEQTTLLIPARVAAELVKLGAETEVKIGYLSESHQVLFENGEILLISQIIDGNFPDYQKIMPKELETSLVSNREELFQAVKAAYIFARDNSNMMKWEVGGGKIAVSAVSPERGECLVEVPAQITGAGGTIVFNAKFVMDYLAIVKGESICFGMNGSLAPGMFWEQGDEGGKYVVMPINV